MSTDSLLSVSTHAPLKGLLAESPADFQHCANVVCQEYWPGNDILPPVISSRGVRIEFPCTDARDVASIPATIDDRRIFHTTIAVLGCRLEDDYVNYLALCLVDTDGNRSTVSRLTTPLLLPIISEFSELSDVKKKTRLLNINAEQDDSLRYHGNFIRRTLPHESSGYAIGRVHTRAIADYDQRTRILKIEQRGSIFGVLAAIFFHAQGRPDFAIILGASPIAKAGIMNARNEFGENAILDIAWIKCVSLDHLPDDLNWTLAQVEDLTQVDGLSNDWHNEPYFEHSRFEFSYGVQVNVTLKREFVFMGCFDQSVDYVDIAVESSLELEAKIR
jgi:hypothetical protein